MTNAHDGRWLVEVDSGVFDLSSSDNVFSFPHSDAYAFQSGAKTFMTSWDFEDCDNEYHVRHEGDVILGNFSTFTQVVCPDLNIVAGRVFREMSDGKLMRFGELESYLRAHPEFARASNLLRPVTRSDWLVALQLRAASRTNPHLKVATTLLTAPARCWGRPYRALTELEVYLGGRVDEADLCSFRERLAMEFTFSSRDLGPTPWRPLPKTEQETTLFKPPMTLQETYGLLINSLRQVLGRLVNC